MFHYNVYLAVELLLWRFLPEVQATLSVTLYMCLSSQSFLEGTDLAAWIINLSSIVACLYIYLETGFYIPIRP